MSSPRIAALVPTYQNVGTLGEVIDQTLRWIPDLIVVDDGATDGTRELLDARDDIVVLHHPHNRGKGAALLSGFAHARSLGWSHVITLDSDLQHDPAEIPRFVEAILQDPSALIIGARDMGSENVPWRSKFGMRCSNLGIRVLTGLRLPDSQSGFRAYPLLPLAAVELSPSRFELEVEVIVRAARAGIPIRSIEIPVHYAPPGQRVTHFRPIRDFLRVLALDLRLLAGWRKGRRSGHDG